MITYIALGDSISIDKYTGVEDGGAASQFAKRIGATSFLNLTVDGCTTTGVMDALDRLSSISPSIFTLTVGGNDLLEHAYGLRETEVVSKVEPVDSVADTIIADYIAICNRLKEYGCPVITNTIYDPTGGSNEIALRIGLSAGWRNVYRRLNDRIKLISVENSFLCSDLEALFVNHGVGTVDPWIVQQIEPNLAGASQIASSWQSLYDRALGSNSGLENG